MQLFSWPEIPSKITLKFSDKKLDILFLYEPGRKSNSLFSTESDHPKKPHPRTTEQSFAKHERANAACL